MPEYIMALFRTLKTLRALTSSDLQLFLEAYRRLFMAWFGVRYGAFSQVAKRFGTHMLETTDKIEPNKLAVAQRVGWAVYAAARRTPWRSTCLIQAHAANRMLHDRHISSTLYLGVTKDRDTKQSLKAHAWLRSGPKIITGAEGREQFTVVSTFADEQFGSI